MAPKAKSVFVSSLLLGLSVTSFARIGETMKRLRDMVKSSIMAISMVKKFIRLRKMVLISWRIFTGEKLTVSCIAGSRVAN
jgi:hypothetical protein